MSGLIVIDALDAVETRGRKRKHDIDARRAWEQANPERAREIRKKARGKYKANKKQQRLENIAILDMETDPFDSDRPEEQIHPFCACLYSDKFEPVVIWEEDHAIFVSELLLAISSLDRPYTIYAHNGGKFDYMFLVHKLRGRVSFKGRGIMSAKIGRHQLRDSFHIIPERLANYKKDDFDYEKMRKSKRASFRDEIVHYLINDCKYLLEIVKAFVAQHGLKISIGQAAMAELKKHYPNVQNLGENTDATLREYFFGGRVECLAGKGHFKAPYKLYDVNSMYPYAMSAYRHPISNDYTLRRKGGITEATVFLDITCRNYGALVRRTEDNETTAQAKDGRFLTTIWEYEAALELDLIENVKINAYIDNAERTDFSKFVAPLYEKRQETKRLLKTLEENSTAWNEAKKDDIFTKLLLNNAYGKFAQNPRRFKESFITEPDCIPDAAGWESIVLPHFQCADYWIWQRPSPRRKFNNVGTAASITGAARAILMRAIAGATDPIYCDTDSLICRSISGVPIHAAELGAWDLEAEFSEVLIAGKKLYACKDAKTGKTKVKSKGAAGLTWGQMLAILDGEIISSINPAPTLLKTGQQFYMQRSIRATAPLVNINAPRIGKRKVAA